MNTKKKFWMITRNIILFIVAVFLIWVVFHQIMTVYEKKKYPPLGQLVEIDGKKMHVYTKGDGENTIVLLSGLGTAAPVLDFEPLLNELAKKNNVVVVESFGYGWSDVTNKERTVENIVEEIRTALKKANIEGPYILMPHSVSGIYSLYFANKYPKEVKAIIGNDPTFPKAWDYFGEPFPKMPTYMSYIAPIGIARLGTYVLPNEFLPVTDEGTYSDKNVRITKALSAWKISNATIISEANEIESNVNKTIDMSFPSEIPVMVFARKVDKDPIDGKTNITFYQNQLSNNTKNKLVVLEGHHYLHWTHYKEMSEYVNDFTATLE